MTTIENDLIAKSVRWYHQTSRAIYKAGGVPEGIIDRIPEELLATMIRNNLVINYEPNL